MARTDTLGNFLTDVAEAIRTKEGTTETIPASEFDTRISNLSGGGSEDLSEELGTYNEELTEQKATIKTIVQTLQNKASGGSGGSGVVINPITPVCYMNDYLSTSVTTNATQITTISHGYSDSGDTSSVVLPGIVAIFVRDNFTLSDNLEILFETEWTVYDGISQKLVLCWCDDVNQDFTITQESEVRMGIGYVCFLGKQRPNFEVFKNEYNYSFGWGIGNKSLEIKEGITIYFATAVYSNSIYTFHGARGGRPNLYLSAQNNTNLIGAFTSDRLGIFVYYSDVDKTVNLTGSQNDSDDMSVIALTVR